MSDTHEHPHASSSAHAHGDGGHHHDHDHDHDHARGGDDLAVHHDADAICIDQVSYRYPSADRRVGDDDPLRPAAGDALRDITLHVEYGCNLGIIGPNGAGKTTLLKIMLGLLDGYSGGVTIGGLSPKAACARGDVIGYVPQRAEAEWRFPVTARQVVLMGLTGKTGLFRRHRKADRDYAEQIMRRVGVAELGDRPIGDLSGGQQQRLFIARALVAQPRILILDEPFVGVDEAGQQRFAGLIHELHQTLKLTIVIVSHDIQTIAAGCDRVACLKQTIHYHAAPAGLTEGVLKEIFQHEIAPVRADWSLQRPVE